MQPPFVTRDLPGIGGELKREPADFVVEELPETTPSGDGEHLWLWIEKRDVDHLEMLRRLQNHLGIGEAEIGYAGMKDRRAITRQWVSVPARCAGAVEQLTDDAIAVRRIERHTDKLRMGRLRGNRFAALLRKPGADAAARARTILDRLVSLGLPNFFGPQRFGKDGDNAEVGRAAMTALGRGERPTISGRRLRLMLSALQAELFNAVLSARLESHGPATYILGDLALDHRTGLLRWVDDKDLAAPTTTLPRPRFVPTGPMWGGKMRRPRADALALERRVLAAAGLTERQFTDNERTPGTRRPLLVELSEIEVEAVDDGVWIRFSLPAGAYATIVLAEVMKTADADALDPAVNDAPPEADD